jgi:hypothetical protein
MDGTPGGFAGAASHLVSRQRPPAFRFTFTSHDLTCNETELPKKLKLDFN